MNRFFARLRGSEEVPPVSTTARGNFTAELTNNGRAIRFRLIVEDIRNAMVAHIHLGERGENGPVVVFLAGPLRRPISVRRGVITGTIRRRDLVGPLQGMSLARLVREMRAGNTYVNVHTTQNPNGEIRGQIRHVRN